MYTFTMLRGTAKAISWTRAAVMLLAVLFGTALIVLLWYYLVIVLPQQASYEAQAQVDAMDLRVRAMYCHGEPYATQDIRIFCTTPRQ